LEGGEKLARQKNLRIQMHDKLNSILKIGESRHEHKKIAKREALKNKETFNHAKTKYIHSVTTAENYRQSIENFTGWLKEKHQEIWSTKDLSNIDKSVAYEYLREREEKKQSAWTVSREMSALNKILELNLTKKEGGLSVRKREEIVRSRLDREHDRKFNAENYKEQIEFAKAFGLRRESFIKGDYRVKESSLFKDRETGRLYVSLIEKGGRYREAPCLEKYQSVMEGKYDVYERETFLNNGNVDKNVKNAYIEFYKQSDSDYLFDKYTNKIDNHAYRREYAQELYKQLINQKEEVNYDYRNEYDSEVVKQVSEALGHSRLDVTIDSYLK